MSGSKPHEAFYRSRSPSGAHRQARSRSPSDRRDGQSDWDSRDRPSEGVPPWGRPSTISRPLSTRKLPTNSQHSWKEYTCGNFVDEIPREGLTSESDITSTDGFTTVCSYQWMMSSEPKIYVPGGPRKWDPPSLPRFLPSDQGASFSNENNFRAGRHTFEPMFQAISVMNPQLRFNDVDVVCDRGAIRSLMGYASRSFEKPFFVAAVMIKNTMFLCERQLKDQRVMNGSTGYGHTFEQQFTKDVMNMGERAGSYYRVHCFKLGNLKIMVRHEVDAYLEDPAAVTTQPTIFPSDISNPGNSTHPHATSVEIKGCSVDPHSMAELKSGNNNKDVISQLWWGRTPWLCKAIHNGEGWFLDTTTTNESLNFAAWENDRQQDLKATVGLLGRIKEKAAKQGGKVMVVLSAKDTMLELYDIRDHRFKVIPEGFTDLFWT